MPFNGFFQYPNALLVESANFVAKNAAYTAAAGDVVVCNTGTVGAGSAGTFIVTLPAVGLGGPVTVLNWNATTVGGTVYVVTADGSTIDGTSGTIGTTLAVVSPNYTSTASANVNLRARNTFSSDGTSWWRVA